MDWTDVVSALVGAVIGGGITGWFTLRGVTKSGDQTRQLATDEAERTRREAAQERVRDRTILALEQTRTLLLDQLGWHERQLLVDPTAVEPGVDADTLPLASILLVGDRAAATAYAALIVEMANRIPMTTAEPREPLKLSQLDVDLMGRCAEVRGALTKAIEVQVQRALCDEPIIELEPAAPGDTQTAGEAIREILRERQRRGAARATPDSPPAR